MNILLDKLPKQVEINQKKYEIRSDFKQGIQFEMLMSDPSVSYLDKMLKAILIYYPKVSEDISASVEKLIWFYNCGIDLVEKKNPKGRLTNKPVYSYEQDQYLIYSAFLQYYHIDLNDIDYLHWWKFKQLFHELPDDSKIKKVMMYRSIPITSNMTEEQRQFYANMKSIYRLKDDRSETQIANSFASILASGMMNAPEYRD